LLKKYPRIDPVKDPARLLAQQVRQLQYAAEIPALEAKMQQLAADPALHGYKKWMGDWPSKPADAQGTPTQIRSWLQTEVDALDQWKQFEAEGGIKEFNRLGGVFDPQGKMSVDTMLSQLRWAKGQEKALHTAIATDDQTIAQAQARAIQQNLRDAQKHYCLLPRPSAVVTFARRGQCISTQLGNGPAGLTKLQQEADQLREEAATAVPIYTEWDRKLPVLKQVISLLAAKKHPRATDMATAWNDANKALDEGRAEDGRTACQDLDQLVKEATAPKK
jgi:hypothetical protein